MTNLGLARVDDGGLLAVLDGTAGRAGGLNGLDDTAALGIGDLAEDDVAAVQPAGDDGGDEELAAVAGERKKVNSCVQLMVKGEAGIHTCWGQR